MKWQRAWDSNPDNPFRGNNGFRDRRPTIKRARYGGGGGNRTHSSGFRDRRASRYATPHGLGDGNRTRTLFPTPDFKSGASASSATPRYNRRFKPRRQAAVLLTKQDNSFLYRLFELHCTLSSSVLLILLLLPQARGAQDSLLLRHQLVLSLIRVLRPVLMLSNRHVLKHNSRFSEKEASKRSSCKS